LVCLVGAALVCLILLALHCWYPLERRFWFLMIAQVIVIGAYIIAFAHWLNKPPNLEEMLHDVNEKYRLTDRAKTAGKRFSRWLDRKLPPDDADK